MNKKQQEEQRRQEYAALNCGLRWVAAAAVVEVLLFLISRYAFDFDATASGVALASALRTMLGAGRILGAVALVVGAGLALTKKDARSKWYVVVGVAGGVLLVCAHVALKYENTGLRMLYLLVPVLGGLALSFYLYQREFFLAALPVVVGALGLWLARVGGPSLETILTQSVGVGLLVAVVMLKKFDGAAGPGKAQLIPQKAEYTPALISAVVALVLQVAAVVAGSMVAYYLIFAMGAWLFALLVYYTVKML